MALPYKFKDVLKTYGGSCDTVVEHSGQTIKPASRGVFNPKFIALA